MNRPKSAMSRNEEEMVNKARIKLQTEKDPLERLRLLCLQRGSAGILGFGKIFRRMDDNSNGTLCTEEFVKGIKDSGMNDLTEDEVKEIYTRFDKDGSGTINYNEFLREIRPPMNQNRIKLVDMAYTKLDSTGDKIVTIEDVAKSYSVKHHPKYLSGEETEDEIRRKFLARFEENGTIDGKVTIDEFYDYYSGISASIDTDAYFDLMMRTAWKL